MEEVPLVSVCIITYNHANFIRQAIDGVIIQQVSFKWELIIADDHSTDGTREILEEYRNKYPEFIKLILQDQNVGAAKNWLDLITTPKGKYIAYFEGDDYWNDPLKLQKQIGYLEENSKYVACCCDVYEKNDSKMNRVYSKSNIITISDLTSGNKIYTCSVVFRNIVSFPEWFWQCKMGDWILWLLLAERGPFYNISDAMAVYRIHHNSSWIGKGKESNLKDIIAAYEILMINMESKYKYEFKTGAKQHYNQLLNLLSAKKSKKIFYWTFCAFKLDFDIKWFGFLIRYFINLFNFNRKVENA